MVTNLLKIFKTIRKKCQTHEASSTLFLLSGILHIYALKTLSMPRRNLLSAVIVFSIAFSVPVEAQHFEHEYSLFKKIGFGQLNGQFNTPIDMTMDADNNIYVVELASHRVQIFKQDGTFIRSFGAYGSADGFFNGPRGIAVDKDKNIYVSDGNAGHRIQVFDNNGTFLRKINLQSDCYSFSVDTDGNLYAGLRSKSEIVVFNKNGTLERTIASIGNGDGQVAIPVDVKLDANKNIYVSDQANGRIQVFANNGTFIRKFGSNGSGDGQFGATSLITVASNGDVYVCDYFRSVIHVFANDGTFIKKILLPLGSTASGVRVDMVQNKVYYVDNVSHTVRVVDLNGAAISTIGFKGKADAQFDFPDEVSFDISGNLFVFDRGNNRFQVFSPDGSFLKSIAITGSGARFYADVAFDSQQNIYFIIGSQIWVYTQTAQLVRKIGIVGQSGADGLFDFPHGIFIDKNDQLYVADTQNKRVQILTKEGTFIRKIGDLNSPIGVVVDGDGKVYISDSGTSDIRVYDNAGGFVRLIGSHDGDEGKMSRPYGLALDNTGKLYVADEGKHAIMVFTTEGEFLAEFGSYGLNEGEFISPRSVAVDGEGNVFVADSYSNRVQVFKHELVVGVEEKSQEVDVSIYPNPVSAELQIEVKKSGVENIQIQTALGQSIRKVSTDEKSSSTYSVNVSDVPGGLYFVRASFTDGSSTVKRVLIKD